MVSDGILLQKSVMTEVETDGDCEVLEDGRLGDEGETGRDAACLTLIPSANYLSIAKRRWTWVGQVSTGGSELVLEAATRVTIPCRVIRLLRSVTSSVVDDPVVLQ